MTRKTSMAAAALIWVVTGLTLFAAWLTHIIVCLKLGLWGFLVAGAIFAPIGIVHGIGIWLGAW